MIITDLAPEDAQRYFLTSEAYTNIELPPYFNFNNILAAVKESIEGRTIQECSRTRTAEDGRTRRIDPRFIDGVNYEILSNKDGEFAWRPYELIHPALYVCLTNLITSPENWALLQNKFEEYRLSGIKCESMPRISLTEESDGADQVKHWWTAVEQRSLELGLKYEYVYDADITNCYGSIYTHAIAWAIHGKEKAKKARNDPSLLGNSIDLHIRMMRNGQTNGIPQGSVMMDFVAEILLGYIDTLVANKLKGSEVDEYEIIRYRDDYRVFTNNPDNGRRIIKIISEELSGFGMKLNTAKTRQSSDPILAAVKDDKLDELFIPRNKVTMQKWLLQIYVASTHHPNSGKVSRMLNRFYDALRKTKKLSDYDNALAMLSIAINIAIRNPKTYLWAMGIVSELLELYAGKDKVRIIHDIRHKFERIPNTGLLDVWLQRISYNIDPHISYADKLTLLISSIIYPGNIFWNTSWLLDEIRDACEVPIIDHVVLKTMPDMIERAEIELFMKSYR